jgi:hypothetical protein
MSDRRYRDLKRTLATLADQYGASVAITPTWGGHFRATFAVGDRKAHAILAATPSDWRNARNDRTLVRRVLRTANDNNGRTS